MANKGQQSNSYKKETKEEIVRKYIEEGISAGALSKEYSIPKGTIKTWIHRFRHQGGGLEDTDAKPIFHSDRGSQYTNKVFHQKLVDAGMIQSMSRVGRCLDNAPMEGWWGILKSEMYYLKSLRAVNLSFPPLKTTYTFTILAVTKSV